MSKKYPCTDCRFCQECGENRCRVCRKAKSKEKRLSIAEQIELYERINGNTGSAGRYRPDCRRCQSDCRDE